MTGRASDHKTFARTNMASEDWPDTSTPHSVGKDVEEERKGNEEQDCTQRESNFCKKNNMNEHVGVGRSGFEDVMRIFGFGWGK